MRGRIIGLIALGAAVAAGSFIGYKVATDKELRGRLTRGAKDAFSTSKKKIDAMSEDVALRTAQLTKNPQINKDWVANQWDAL